MAHKNQTLFFPCLLAMTLLLALAVETVAAGRNIPTKNDNVDVKQPQWLLDHDGSFLIPGIGRVMLPPKFQSHFPSYPPQYGSTGPVAGASGGGPVAGGGGGESHIPGGDDTPISDPGVNVPSPAVGGAYPSPP